MSNQDNDENFLKNDISSVNNDNKSRRTQTTMTSVKTVSIDDIIDELGMHQYNIWMLILVGFSLVSYGIHQFTIYLLIPVFKDEFGVTIIMNSILVSASIFGLSIGSLAGGWLSTKYGEKYPFLIANGVTAVISALFVTIDNFYWWLFCRIVIGMALGVTINYTSNMFENLPQKYRGSMSTFIFLFQDLGVVVYPLIFYLFTLGAPEKDTWKNCVLVSTVPMWTLFILNIFFFEESPRKLLWNQRFEDLFKNIDKYAGEENFLSNEKKEYLINQVQRKMEKEARKKLTKNTGFFQRLSNAFALDFWLNFILMSMWMLYHLYEFSSSYYLPILLDEPDFKKLLFKEGMAGAKIEAEMRSKGLITNEEAAALDVDSAKALEIATPQTFVQLNSFLKLIGRSQVNRFEDFTKKNSDNEISCLTAKRKINKRKNKQKFIIRKNDDNNNLSSENELKNKIFKIKNSSINYLNGNSLLKKQEPIEFTPSPDTNTTNNIVDEVIQKETEPKPSSLQEVMDKLIDDVVKQDRYIAYSEKYVKIMAAEATSMIGTIIVGLVAHSNFSRKYLLLILLTISLGCTLGKIFAMVYVEYFIAILRSTSKAQINIGKLYTCENFHSDYRETVYAFYGFMARLSFFLGPYFADAMMVSGIYTINYYECGLAGLLFILLFNLKKDDPSVEVDNLKSLNENLEKMEKNKTINEVNEAKEYEEDKDINDLNKSNKNKNKAMDENLV